MLPFFTLILLLKILDLTYFFQIKEYRIDRIMAAIYDLGFKHIMYEKSIRMPAKSIRNVLIVGFSFTLTIYGVLYLSLHPPTPLTQILLLFVSPFISFLIVWTGVVLTWPLAYIRRYTLIKKAKAHIHKTQVVRIGISGTYGKSSVKEILTHILNERFETAKTDKNMNTPVGVAISILKNIKNTTQVFIAEVGGYKRGEVAQASTVFSPQHAILTPFGNQHLALYGSKENLIETESEIINVLPKYGHVYIPFESRDFIKATPNIKTYALNNKKASVFATNIETTSHRSKARIHLGKQYIDIETHLIGVHTIQNLLPCIGLALDLGVSKAQVKKAIANLKQIEGKLSTHEGKKGATVLNDTGNSSYEGFIAAIDTLNLFNKSKKLIISNGIIELGKEKEISYKNIINHMQKYNNILYTTDYLFKKYDHNDSIIIRYNNSDLLNVIKDKLDTDTIVLLEGRFPQNFITFFMK